MANKELKGRIVAMYGTQEKFGKAMGWDNAKTSIRLSNLEAWRLTDIRKAVKVLRLRPQEIQTYFFKN